MMSLLEVDKPIFFYQISGDAEKLIKKFKPFIQKYVDMILYETIDFRNYELRYFLSCFIRNKKIRSNLRGSYKYHSKETIKMAYNVLRVIRMKFRFYTENEIFNELLIPFLECAQEYKLVGSNFDNYVYKSYKYRLLRHINNMQFDALDFQAKMSADDVLFEEEWYEEQEDDFFLILEEELELNDPGWIHGKKSEEPFSSMEPHERYILVQYYLNGKTDKEIARMLPYHPKSISRIRNRLINQLNDLFTKGEIKCLRPKKC